MIWPTISSAVRLRTSVCVPVWQKVQVRVQPTWRGNAQGAAVFFGNVDGFDFVALAALVGRQAQEPLHRAVRGFLLGDDFGAGNLESLVQLFAQVAGDMSSSPGRR